MQKETVQKSTRGFEMSRSAQYRTVEELIDRSRPNFTYYVLLFISTIIIAAGLLLNNSAIVIGGMLVTPLLTPILVIALGISVGDTRLIGRVIKFLGLSFLYVFIAGLVLTLIFGEPDGGFTLLPDTLRTAVLYFVIAIASGVAATFAWIQKDASEALPGIAIAVSLVPPLAMIGVGFGTFTFAISGFYLTIFILNFFGILMGSLMVFSLSKFNKVEQIIQKKNEEIIVEENLKKIEKEERKKEEQEEIEEKTLEPQDEA
jgi:uncharacterized hydrophobic protein (TIGR00271 family)